MLQNNLINPEFGLMLICFLPWKKGGEKMGKIIQYDEIYKNVIQ